jgi:ribosomal protein S7
MLTVKKRILKKKMLSDPIYKSTWLLKFINCFFKQGRKIKYEKNIITIIYKIKKHYSINFLLLFFEFIEKIKPSFCLRKRKKGINIFEVPTGLDRSQQYKIAMDIFFKLVKEKPNSDNIVLI